VQITRFTPDDADAVRAYVEVANAASAVDAPWMQPRTVDGTTGALRHGWDGEPSVPFLAEQGGRPVATGSYRISERDNRHVAGLAVDVHPDHRRRGHGSAMLQALTQAVADLGRTTLLTQCWDDDRGGAEFARHHGFTRASVAVNRGQHLPDVDPALIDRIRAEAAAAAIEYELVRMPAVTPEEERAAVAEMVAAINDAPLDDLDLEDEVFDAERVHAYEDAHRQRRIRLYRLVARHRPTGALAGQTVVAVEDDRPWFGEQHDTSVVSGHRGHRLGAYLKTGMLHWLREEQPQLEWIYTWNAESNGFMVGVNELLGYQVLGRELEFQKTL
jgi:GNAT superfamily N-acetyltransferase